MRIKVLHALYAYFQSESKDLVRGLGKLQDSIDQIEPLYCYELKALTDIQRIAEDEMERRKNKRLPTAEDLNPSPRFIQNQFLHWLRDHKAFQQAVTNHKVSWREHRDVLRKIFKSFSESEEFREYQQLPENTLAEDKRIVKFLYGRFLVPNELIHQIYEDYNIHWADDLDAAQAMVARTIKRFDGPEGSQSGLVPLIKDKADREFARVLFQQVVNRKAEFEEMIREKAQHWEVERIALLDIILMMLALAELTSFSEIPVKVTLNEYIDLGKEYSTPKSGNFINGILDRLKSELQEKGAIHKVGRGLL